MYLYQRELFVPDFWLNREQHYWVLLLHSSPSECSWTIILFRFLSFFSQLLQMVVVSCTIDLSVKIYTVVLKIVHTLAECDFLDIFQRFFTESNSNQLRCDQLLSMLTDSSFCWMSSDGREGQTSSFKIVSGYTVN